MCFTLKAEESVCNSGPFKTTRHATSSLTCFKFVDCSLGSSRPGGRTHLETEVWEEPLPASWVRTEVSVRPRSFAGTPFCQLSIKRDTFGHCQLDRVNPSVRCHSSSLLFPISWLTFLSSSSILASLVPVRFHLQLLLPLAVHHNCIPQDPPVRVKPSALPPRDTLPGEVRQLSHVAVPPRNACVSQ